MSANILNFILKNFGIFIVRKWIPQFKIFFGWTLALKILKSIEVNWVLKILKKAWKLLLYFC